MIYELDMQDYEKVRPLFASLNYHLVIFSIIEGNSPGRVYVDDVDHPQSAFVWDKVEAGFYLAGREDNDAFNEALNKCILTEIAVEAKQFPSCIEFVMNYFPDTWESKLNVVLRDTFPMKHYRQHFTLKQLKVDWKAQIPDGFVMTQVDEELLTRTQLKNIDHVTRWVRGNWQSVENFIKKGFGFCLLHENDIVSWCIADFVAGNDYEMGIHTDEDYLRRGFATLTAAAAVDYCLANGVENIGWHCWSSNVASAATAKKVGFEETIEHPVYHAWYNKFDNLLVQGWFNLDQYKKYREAAEAYETAFKMKEANEPDALASRIYSNEGDEGWCHYSAARAWALAGDGDSAFRNLHKAIDTGWSHLEHLQKDDDLKSLHKDKRWEELLKNK
jgi:RimJ/RimL family protein N-acetyltransferase